MEKTVIPEMEHLSSPGTAVEPRATSHSLQIPEDSFTGPFYATTAYDSPLPWCETGFAEPGEQREKYGRQEVFNSVDTRPLHVYTGDDVSNCSATPLGDDLTSAYTETEAAELYKIAHASQKECEQLKREYRLLQREYENSINAYERLRNAAIQLRQRYRIAQEEIAQLRSGQPTYDGEI
jgi:hypothetical protein